MVERRSKLLLRSAIEEVQAVAGRARAMADSLAELVAEIPSGEVPETTEELVALRLLARDVDVVVDRVLGRERQWFFDPATP